MCCLQLTGGQRAPNTFRAGLPTKLHVSHTAPVPELIRSLLPRPGVQATVLVSLALHYCQREKGSSVYITGNPEKMQLRCSWLQVWVERSSCLQ